MKVLGLVCSPRRRGNTEIMVKEALASAEKAGAEVELVTVWCSQRDVAQMVEKCIEAPESMRYDIFYVLSNNKWSYRDLDHARSVVGFEPQDNAEDYRPKL